MKVQAQSNKFDSLWNGLTFNIYTGNPDTVVLPFLKSHFPYLAKTPKSGGWVVSSDNTVPHTVPQQGIHSLRIAKHPFIQIDHMGARLDFLTQEWPEGPPGIERTRIWIYFDTKMTAETAYGTIVEEFKKIGADVCYLDEAKQKKVIVQRAEKEKSWESLSVVLRAMPDNKGYSIGILFFDDNGDTW